MKRLSAAILALSACWTPAALAQPASPPSAVMPDGPGRAVVERACAQCHALTVVAAANYSREEWQVVLHAMMHFGAQLTPDEFALATDYLSKTFPAKAPAGRAPTSAPVKTSRSKDVPGY